MKVELKYVPVSLVDFNEGQLEGVPAREIRSTICERKQSQCRAML